MVPVGPAKHDGVYAKRQPSGFSSIGCRYTLAIVWDQTEPSKKEAVVGDLEIICTSKD